MEKVDTGFVAECSTYDFKRELDRNKKGSWLKSVSAFANTKGGSLYFGINNDGQVVGLSDAQSDVIAAEWMYHPYHFEMYQS